MTDFSDHKRWKLLLIVGERGLDAAFFDREGRQGVPYMSRRWNCDPTQVLGQVEDALYDDPRLLDDYDTSILISPRATLLVPPAMFDPKDTAANTEALSALDQSEHKDVWHEPLDEAIALYSTAEGLRDFLRRTFLTEDMHHLLRPMTDYFSRKAGAEGGWKMWVDLGPGVMDIVAYGNGRLLYANRWHYTGGAEDAAYYLLFIFRTLGLPEDSAELYLSGSQELRRAISPMLRRHISYVSQTLLPSAYASAVAEGIPLTAVLKLMNNKELQ